MNISANPGSFAMPDELAIFDDCATPAPANTVIIWSAHHRAYLRPGRQGHTSDFLHAGAFTPEQAKALCSTEDRDHGLRILPLAPAIIPGSALHHLIEPARNEGFQAGARNGHL